MGETRGNHSPFVVSNQRKALTSRRDSAERFLVGRPSKRLKVCCVRHMACGASPPRRCLAQAGERGGNRV
jgi:hypothetical protein